MQFSIEVLSVSNGTQPTKTGKTMEYLEVAYKKDGKVEGKKLFKAFAKETVSVLQNAQQGETYTITAEKEGDFWQWKSVTSGGAASSTSSASSSASPSAHRSDSSTKSPVKGEWETRDERAARQVMIVKQSSLSNAIATLKTDNSTLALLPVNVLALAQQYTDWVLSQPKVATLATMEDDIPL